MIDDDGRCDQHDCIDAGDVVQDAYNTSTFCVIELDG